MEINGYRLSKHAAKRFKERGVRVEQVQEALTSGSFKIHESGARGKFYRITRQLKLVVNRETKVIESMWVVGF